MLARLQLSISIVQAPMAGVSTPRLAAAVSNAGGLGSIAVGATDAADARTMIDETQALTRRAINVNVFVHATPAPDAPREAAWLTWLAPRFADYGAAPPPALRTIYQSFADDPEMLSVLLDTRPAVVSFHFGLPAPDVIGALKARGIFLLATATNLDEARQVEAAGLDGIVAQGIEAGGHRGSFDDAAPGDIGLLALLRLVRAAAGADLPLVGMGGLADGPAVAAVLAAGAAAAGLGTAFMRCPEAATSPAHRDAIGDGTASTALTRAFTGRTARGIVNRFQREHSADAPSAYPEIHHLTAPVRAAARERSDADGFHLWAGQAYPLAQALPAAELVRQLAEEARSALVGAIARTDGSRVHGR